MHGANVRTSLLYRHIASLQGDAAWGSFLDAGTGVNSLTWAASLGTDRWTAVTGAQAHAEEVHDAVAAWMRPADRIVVGNWADERLLAGEVYDTVLADYLLGAIERFSPYFQEEMFHRLRQLTGRVLYLIGVEPYVQAEPSGDAGRMIYEIGRMRDACLLLAGERPYREYPGEWMAARLKRAGFRVAHARRFPIRYKARFVNSQLDMCRRCLSALPDRDLAAALEASIASLRRRALDMARASDGLRFGFDFAIAAHPV